VLHSSAFCSISFIHVWVLTDEYLVVYCTASVESFVVTMAWHMMQQEELDRLPPQWRAQPYRPSQRYPTPARWFQKKKTPARCFSFFTTFLGSYLLIKRFSITNLPMVRKQPEVIKFVRAKNSSANQKKIRTISIAIILSCFSSNVVRVSFVF
jgi:hypothetical protein